MAASGAAAAGAASDEGGTGNAKMEARAGAGGSWGDNGQLWHVVACVVWATAMRGHHGLHAAAMSWRRSEFVSERDFEPDSEFTRRLNCQTVAP